MKRFLVLSLLWTLAFAKEEIHITADRFEADEMQLVSVFSQNVVVTRDKDLLKADTVTVHFDAQKQPQKIIATGNNAHVSMILSGKSYEGEAKTITYEPQIKQYRFEGNAFLHELGDDKKIFGNLLTADQSSGKYQVIGEKNKPATFIFEIEPK